MAGDANAEMPLVWGARDEEVRLRALSRRWEDDGVALEYVATYSPEDAEWVLTFEGAMLARGSLGECLAAAMEHERL